MFFLYNIITISLLQIEIERLQKEGSKQVEEEIAFMKKYFEERSKTFHKESEIDSSSYKLKVKWKSRKNQSNNNEYDYDTLYQIFSKVYIIIMTFIIVFCHFFFVNK